MKRIQSPFELYASDVKALNRKAKTVGCSKSFLVRQLVRKYLPKI
jgi:hypothetical protein